MASNTDNTGGEPTLRRRESLSEIRAANPDLALSGNIISATFNTPHSFVYRKGGDWVCRLFRFTFASPKTSMDPHLVSARWTGVGSLACIRFPSSPTKA